MIFTPYEDELKRINHIHNFNDKDYCLIRLTSTMIEKNNIDANEIMRDLLLREGIVDYSKILAGGENGRTVPAIYLSYDKRYDGNMKFYRVTGRGKRKDRRFSIKTIKKLRNLGFFKESDLLYISTNSTELIVVNLTQRLPEDSILKRTFAQSQVMLAAAQIIPKIITIAKEGYHPNSKGRGKVDPKDAGDTLESLLNIETNNRPDADFKGLIELKTKTGKNLQTLFTKRPRFDGTPIAQIEQDDRKRVSAYTRYYGYLSPKHPNAKSLYLTIGPAEAARNGYGLFLVVNEKSERVELWAPNPKNKQAEFSAYWTFSDLQQELEKKHPATIWLSVEVKHEPVAKFKYIQATLTLAAQFTTFISMIKAGKITYDWRGYTSLNGKYSGKNHGNAWRIDASYRDFLFVSNWNIDLQR